MISSRGLGSNAAVYAGRNLQKDRVAAGFLWVLAAEDGKKIADLPLEAPPAYDGLALANGGTLLPWR